MCHSPGDQEELTQSPEELSGCTEHNWSWFDEHSSISRKAKGKVLLWISTGSSSCYLRNTLQEGLQLLALNTSTPRPSFPAFLGLTWRDNTFSHFLFYFSLPTFFPLLSSALFLTSSPTSHSTWKPLHTSPNQRFKELWSKAQKVRNIFFHFWNSTSIPRAIFQSQCLPFENLWKPCSKAVSSQESYLRKPPRTPTLWAWSYFPVSRAPPHASSLAVLRLPPPFL